MADSTTKVYPARSPEEVLEEVFVIIQEQKLTFPLLIRPAFPLDDNGWFPVFSESEVKDIVEKALKRSPVDEVSVRGWFK